MSVLNDQTKNTNDDSDLRDSFRRSVLSLDSQMSEDDLHRHGLDVDLVEDTYRFMVDRYRKYLLGYESLLSVADRDPHTKRRWERDRLDRGLRAVNPMATWEYTLHSHDILPDADDRVIELFRGSLNNFSLERDQWDKSIALFMTRKGQWILWLLATDSRGVMLEGGEERMVLCRSVREVCETYEEWGLGSYKLGGDLSNAYTPRAKYLPMLINWHLQRIVSETNQRRKAIVDEMDGMLKRSVGRSSRIVVGC